MKHTHSHDNQFKDKLCILPAIIAKRCLMKILVLENDPKEFTTIQQSLNKNGNELIPLVSSEQIWPYLQSEEPLCLIANWDASDIRNTQFIARARAAKPAEALYIIFNHIEEFR